MSRIDRLLESYRKHIAVPWKADAAPMQRVIFCVYDQEDELRLRVRTDEFELATRQAGYEWALYDLTDTFASWLSTHRYAEAYFRKPDLLPISGYLKHITAEFAAFADAQAAGPEHVVALKGVGSLFGLLKVKEVVDRLAPAVSGRLLVFFPGSFEDDNYRLLDGYDGWNYLAVPITADRKH